MQGTLCIEAIGERAIRIRHVLGGEIRNRGEDMLVGGLDRPAARFTVGTSTAELRTSCALLTIVLDPFEMWLVETDRDRSVRIGGARTNYFPRGGAVGNRGRPGTPPRPPGASQNLPFSAGPRGPRVGQ